MAIFVVSLSNCNMKLKIGILGGGQLGKMLYAPASKLDIPIAFMDSMIEGPVASTAQHYRLGDIQKYEEVIDFGRDHNVLSIEIEKVNVRALRKLAEYNIQVFPQPDIIATIQDKGLQKQFYQEHNIPTSAFRTYVNTSEITEDVKSGKWTYPFVQKLRKDGYDGRGVKVIRSEQDLMEGFEAPSLVEEMVDIEKEIAVVTCRSQNGQIELYDPVEMVFHPEQNILLYQLAPARIDDHVASQAKTLAKNVSEAFGIVGLLAIEMFLTVDGQLLVNEVAPRPHNSGHHTIEACYCSQYENHLRAICGWPLGSSKTIAPSLLMNVLGQDGYSGPAHYEGMDEVLGIPGVSFHRYGKTDTKPYRKMGHISVLGEDYEELIEKYDLIRRTLRVVTRT